MPVSVLSSIRLCGLLAGLALVCAGCGGSSGVTLAPVSGFVTFYGRPVRAEILFEPEVPVNQKSGGRASTAISDNRGHYVLSYTQRERGATIGPHRVIVKVLPYADSGEPSTFQDATKPLKLAHLVRQVRAGKNRFDFALSY